MTNENKICNSDNMEIQDTKTYFYWLDSLRFIAAFMVLLSHARNSFFPAFGDLPTDKQNIFLIRIFTHTYLNHNRKAADHSLLFPG